MRLAVDRGATARNVCLGPEIAAAVRVMPRRGAMAEIERHDPFGGAFGAALATRAGDLVFMSVSGVIELRDGAPAFAEGFDEQLRIAGRNAATELAAFGFSSSD